MPAPRLFRRSPGAPAGLVAVLAFAAAGAAPAQTSDWRFEGELAASEPTFHRPYLYQGNCYLSSTGTDVRVDVHEFLLDDAVTPADLAVSLCEGAAFDSVLFLYQRPNGAPGAFDAAAPCDRLVLYSDDYCGSSSRVWSNTLVLGYATAVVTTFENGETGTYTLTADSAGSALQNFLYYGGFETGNLRTWSVAVQ